MSERSTTTTNAEWDAVLAPTHGILYGVDPLPLLTALVWLNPLPDTSAILADWLR